MVIVKEPAKRKLTQDVAFDLLRGFFRETPLVFIGTGVSCAVDVRFGMGALRDALVTNLKNVKLTKSQNAEWKLVVADLSAGIDLENSLNHVTDAHLLDMVTTLTGEFVSSIDREHSLDLVMGRSEWPAILIMKKIVSGLAGADPVLHIVTPNYDMLMEYSLCNAGIPYINGFCGGVLRSLDWDATQRTLLYQQTAVIGGKQKHNWVSRKHVRVHKVHGSLSYFRVGDNIVESHAWMWSPPSEVKRIIVAPGLSKYERLQKYRMELQDKADIAIGGQNRFLFVGYGFNDSHLEEYIQRKLVSQGCHGLIVTRDPNPRIEKILKESDNLWLVCKSSIGGVDGTLIANKRFPSPLHLPNQSLWNIKNFTTEILGE